MPMRFAQMTNACNPAGQCRATTSGTATAAGGVMAATAAAAQAGEPIDEAVISLIASLYGLGIVVAQKGGHHRRSLRWIMETAWLA